MQMLELNKVRVYEKVPGTTNETRLVKVNPYVRLMGKDWPAPVYVQGGKFFGEGGPELDSVPTYVAGELAKMSPEARAEVGLKDVPAAPVVVTEKVDAMWTCPDVAKCQQKMPISTKKKGIHVARFHRRGTEHAGSI